MSILLTVEALDSGKIKINDKVTASKNAMKMGGSQIWLEVGEKMTVEELLKAVVIASAMMPARLSVSILQVQVRDLSI